MITELYMMKNENLKKSSAMYDHSRREYFCSKCNKKMDVYDIYGKKLPQERLDILGRGISSKEVKDMVLLKCKCDDNFKSALAKGWFEEEKEKYSNDPNALQMHVEPSYQMNNNKSRIGTVYNSENDVISVYESGYRWHYGKKGQHIKIPWVTRMSYNFTTGKNYIYKSGSRERTDNGLKNIEYGHCPLRFYLEDKDAIMAFVQGIIKKKNLPVTCQYNADIDDRWFLECGGVKYKIWGASTIASDICKIATAPNIYIRYDAYTGKAQFRKGIGPYFTDDYRYEDNISPTNVIERINPFVPISGDFKKLQPKELMDESKYVKELSQKLNIPTSRRFLSMYRKNPVLMGFIAKWQELGVKDINNINKIIEFFCGINYWDRTSEKKVFPYIKKLIKTTNETVFANRLLSIIAAKNDTSSGNLYGRYNNFLDSAKMYSAIKKAGEESLVSLTGTFNEIHDDLIKLYEKLEIGNETIKTTKTERSRVVENEERYNISLAESTFRLKDIGQTMHICVGSYGQQAIQKKCTIYYVFDKIKKKYEGCLEMRKNVLYQAKGYHNMMLEGDVKDAVIKWVNDFKIDTDGCYDYQHILQCG